METNGTLNSYAYSRPLEGSEKVAILLLALDRPVASELLRNFEQDEIIRIRRAADQLEPITADDLEAIVEEFANQFSTGLSFVGTPGEVHNLLNTALSGDQSAEQITDDEPSPQEPSVWAQIAHVSDELILTLLMGENPQTVAVILTNLEPDQSAKIIGQMPQELSADVMRRMLTLKPANDEVLNQLEEQLRESLLSNQEHDLANAAHSRIANMINQMDGDQRQQIIDSITAVAPDEADAIKKLLFSFEDVLKLSENACQILFGEVRSETIIMALWGAEDVMRERVLSSLSTRSRRMAEAELAGEPNASPSDVADARRKIAVTALGLIRDDRIHVEEEGS